MPTITKKESDMTEPTTIAIKPLPATYEEMVEHLTADHEIEEEFLQIWIEDRSDPDTDEGQACIDRGPMTPLDHLNDLHLFNHDNREGELAHTHDVDRNLWP